MHTLENVAWDRRESALSLSLPSIHPSILFDQPRVMEMGNAVSGFASKPTTTTAVATLLWCSLTRLTLPSSNRSRDSPPVYRRPRLEQRSRSGMDARDTVGGRGAVNRHRDSSALRCAARYARDKGERSRFRFDTLTFAPWIA